MGIFDEIKYFIEDIKYDMPYVYYGAIGSIFVLIGLIIFLTVKTPSGYDSEGNAVEGSVAQLEDLEQTSLKLQEQFTELGVKNISLSDNRIILEISLYLKDPYLSNNEMNNAMSNYIRLIKAKYNDTKSNVFITAVKIKLYDRKLLYDKELSPRNEMYYMLDKYPLLKKSESMKDNDPKKIENLGMGTLEYVWEETINQTGKIDYSKYEMDTGNYRPLELDKGEPLTDEEYAFYLKLKTYEMLKSSTVASVQLYLEWDLGMSVDEDGVSIIIREFEDFIKRQEDISGSSDPFPNKERLKQRLAVQRPQFLLYAEKSELVTDRVEAQKQLVKYNKALYQTPVEADVEARAEGIQKDGTTTYEEGTDFNSTIGVLGKVESEGKITNKVSKRKTTSEEDTIIEDIKELPSSNEENN